MNRAIFKSTLVLMMVSILYLTPTAGSAATIRITSPTTGTVVVGGQSLTVSIDVVSSIGLRALWADIVPGPFNIPQPATTAPYSFPITVPLDRVGMVRLRASAIDNSGNLLQNSVDINIQPPAQLQLVKVLPEEILFSGAGETDYLTLAGSYSDGFVRELSGVPLIVYTSDNQKVIAVGASGKVIAIAPGVTTLHISVSGFSLAVPGSVAKFELVGDLNGDGQVDQADLNILLAALNRPATGPGDPRDLDGDGKITALDARILVTLCTRPRCATK